MSRLSCLLMVLCLGLMSGLADEPKDPQEKTDPIHWLDDLDQAMEMSAKNGRPVIAYFTFKGCVWCRKLEQDTFSDQDVIALSRKFIWVKVNRDNTPEIPKQFNVSAYPSLITLGDKREKIHRFQSYQKPPEFIENLNEALRRYKLYKQGKEWEPPETRPSSICERGSIETLKAPSEERPGGITFVGDGLWVSLGYKLYRLDERSGDFKEVATFDEEHLIVDVCSDGKLLYAVNYGWSAGRPILVIDPRTGKAIRTIVTAANKEKKVHSSRGIACHAGKLYVLSGMSGIIHEIDPHSGEVTREISSAERRLCGLDFDGKHFIAGTKTHLVLLDPKTGEVVRKVPVNYPLRNVAFHQGAFYLLEQPIFGFDKQHNRIRVWPRQTVIHKLTLEGEK